MNHGKPELAIKKTSLFGDELPWGLKVKQCNTQWIIEQTHAMIMDKILGHKISCHRQIRAKTSIPISFCPALQEASKIVIELIVVGDKVTHKRPWLGCQGPDRIPFPFCDVTSLLSLRCPMCPECGRMWMSSAHRVCHEYAKKILCILFHDIKILMLDSNHAIIDVLIKWCNHRLHPGLTK